MKRETLLKFAQVIFIVVLAVGLDQWTKEIASDRLATQRGSNFSHNIYLTVPDDFQDKTLKDYISHEFAERNDETELRRIMQSTTTDAGVLVLPSQPLKAGEKLEVRWREVTIIPDHWDFQYTRNPGAAFSFLADADASIRTPFFIGVSALAVLIIFWILSGVALGQQILIFGLSFVCGGAIGNLIDRVNYGYVIDFIVWKWTDAYRWPTFNIADSFIVAGVALMIIEMIRESLEARREEQEGKPSDDAQDEFA